MQRQWDAEIIVQQAADEPNAIDGTTSRSRLRANQLG